MALAAEVAAEEPTLQLLSDVRRAVVSCSATPLGLGLIPQKHVRRALNRVAFVYTLHLSTSALWPPTVSV